MESAQKSAMLAKNLREDFEQVEREGGGGWDRERVINEIWSKTFSKVTKGDKEKSLSAFKALDYYL